MLAKLELAVDWLRLPSSAITNSSIIFTVAQISSRRMGPRLFLFRHQYLGQILELVKPLAIVEVNLKCVVRVVKRFRKRQIDPQEDHVTSVIMMTMLIIKQVDFQTGSRNSKLEEFEEQLH
jgi:hypothetical protein